MSVSFISSNLHELGLVADIVKNHSLSKIIVYICGNHQGAPNVTSNLCAKILNLYKVYAHQQPTSDLRINVEGLKWLMCSQRDGMLLTDKEKDYMLSVTQHMTNSAAVPPQIATVDDSKPVKLYPNVVLGGTFDRLHVGHKMLLTEAVMRCTQKLTVGVTDESMITGKKLWELIQPLSVRITKLEEFLVDVDQRIEYEIVPISDMFGPTQTDPNLDLLVVTTETQSGGIKVNEVRQKRGLRPLELHVVNLLESDKISEGEEAKVSSSNERLHSLGTRLGKPTNKPILPNEPYLIGLTGGIASGKSYIAQMLAEHGAGTIDCDKVAHMLYRRGSPIYNNLITTFGEDIIGTDGEINRKRLGSIVFSSQEAMQKLNNLLWPAILETSLEEANRLYREEDKTVVVLEAAVLLRAGWDKYVHEVWCCILPVKEAVQRVMDRDKLSEEAATERLKSQPNNSEQISISNVVLSSIYSHEFTQKLVAKAWNSLLEYLSQSSKL